MYGRLCVSLVFGDGENVIVYSQVDYLTGNWLWARASLLYLNLHRHWFTTLATLLLLLLYRKMV